MTTIDDHLTALRRERYIEAHIDAAPASLSEVERRTHLRLVNPRMMSGHLQGRILKMLTRMVAPTTAIEIGTYAGYATACLAEGLPPGGQLHTIEVDDELESFIQESLALTGVADRVTLHIGDAKQVLPTLPVEETTLVFVDGDKRDYCTYLDLLLPRLPIGAYILADNTLWDGKVLDPLPKDRQTIEICRFNDRVATDPQLEKVILPLRDGLTIIRKTAPTKS